ncbi:hypothetical protein FIBSPDRAFT_883831 [Athelia psychrophila]|uniref:Uncharacterized protein n=1 Tax=Athelia psychrophila TaxID=1759441 RepID=A0A166TJV5_9AGAM|nr:hypothetical protein FIBSPDRAFT_883831 [Fibularhizoctonia sp. CBS 109695]
MTTTPSLDFETELDMPFSSSEWINRGQRYPGHADAPLHVHQALLKRTGVPSVMAVERITQASYIAVQLFEHSSAEHFLAIPGPTALLGTLHFAHLPSHTFLFALSPPPFVQGNGDLKLSPGSSLLFRDLKAAPPQVKDAMKLFGKPKPKPKPGHQPDTDEDT